jgi:hypothetical protein
MPTTGSGPNRRWPEALRRLSTPGNPLDNVAYKKFGSPYPKSQVSLDQTQNQNGESPLCRQEDYSHR